ncbi:MAG: antibiotic biosynthesis monooxygenase [Pseudomonadota bacterium]
MGVRLRGELRCGPEDARIVRAALPEHIRLSRAEEGCEFFEIEETAPGVFSVEERFTDKAALVAHQTRTRASDWWQKTGHIPRDIKVEET